MWSLALLLCLQEPTDLTDLAHQYYLEGKAYYDAADYDAAIDSLSRSLAISSASEKEEFKVRALLLYNIANAHLRAFELDKDQQHLKQAQAVLDRLFKEMGKQDFENFELIEDAKKAQQFVENNFKPKVIPKTVKPSLKKAPLPPIKKRVEPKSLGLTLAGSCLTLTGIALVVYGSSFEDSAREKILQGGYSLNDPVAFEFLEQEVKKGRGWIISGALTSVAGTIMTSFGVHFFLKNRVGVGISRNGIHLQF